MADGLFEPIEISPSLILGQSGQRSMWAEVRQLIRNEEARLKAEAAKAKDGAADDSVPEIEDLPATRYAPAAFTADAEAKAQAANAKAQAVEAAAAAAAAGSDATAAAGSEAAKATAARAARTSRWPASSK